MASRSLIFGALGIALFLIVWWISIRRGSLVIPPLSAVCGAITELSANGTLVRDTIYSIMRVGAGVALAGLFAAVLAVVAGTFRWFGYLVSGPLEMLRPIPPIAWIPVAILLFGVGDRPAIAIVALGAFFPIWLNIARGIDEIRDEHVHAARSLGASQKFYLAHVVIPSILPHAFHGLRLGVGLGWFCVVAAEMMGAQSGLGYGVQISSLNLQIAQTYAYIVTIGTVGILLNYLVTMLEARVCPWHRALSQADAFVA